MSYFLGSSLLTSIVAAGQILSAGSISPQQVSPEMIKQLQNTYKSEYQSNSSQFSKYLSDTLTKSARPEEEINKVDREKKDKDKDKELEKEDKKILSVYEQIILGKNIDPDSLLENLPIYGYDVFKNSRPSTFA